MKKFATLILLMCSLILNAQLTFILESIPDYTPAEDIIYIAGNFNQWNTGDDNYQLSKNESDQWQITLSGFNNGETIYFKFTRGSWVTVEKGVDGAEIPNRVFTFGNGQTEYLSVINWADHSSGQSTAAENVYIIDYAFEMPQLNRTRRIWIYLPPKYEISGMDYPVIYMHDGQNLFDAYTSYLGEWEVDETLNNLYNRGFDVPIVVGIDNGGDLRIDELTPYVNPDWGGGEGDEYMAFIVETLKPYVDANYRTLHDRGNTGIMGSSLGGLISTYGALKYQDVFSKSGPFSPAYWINYDSLWNFVDEVGFQEDIRFYQNMGGLESDYTIGLMYSMETSLINIGFENVTSKVIPGADHNEETWKNDFETAYLWLFGDYAGIQDDVLSEDPIYIYPNPAIDNISIKGLDLQKRSVIKLMNVSGQVLREVVSQSSTLEIDVSSLVPGIYVVKIQTESSSVSLKFVKQ